MTRSAPAVERTKTDRPHGVVVLRDQLLLINPTSSVGCDILRLRHVIGCLSLKSENTKVNKQELIDAVASEVGTAKSAAAETIDAFLATVTNSVVKGDPVQLVGFGSFSTGARAARAGRNPKTGEALKIAASTTVKFTAGKAFKDAVNQ